MAKLIATSPFFNPGDGCQHKRYVLKVEYYGTDHEEYIVHDQQVDEDGNTSYSNGFYFPTRDHPNALDSAWHQFLERTTRVLKKLPLSDLKSPRFAQLDFEVRGKG